ncbi:MAG: hypothetical protein CVV35_00350 [Methanomicrobiales archaeon HGW-Methanomicrobiales-6]|jgi:hypothetical protein|nr:MAG: hypothetical protein CVV35_00350 [Methanomicrobiales archaeon HGW-Methanomicrobiales-6]
MFKPVGKIQKDHAALRVVMDGWRLGTLVIAAGDISKLLSGDEVTVNFVQERPGREVFIGYAGTARISRSGRAVNVRIESRLMSAPLAAVQKVLSGQQLAARLSAPAPVIDADREQAKPIDADLVRSFV